MPAACAAVDRVGAGLVDVVGDRVVLDGLGDVLGGGALVADHDLEALVEEGHLAEPVGDRLEGVRRGLEDVLAGPEGDRRAGALVGSIGRTCSARRRARRCVKDWRHRWPRFLTSTIERLDSALTTETPTPCRPPETL